MRPISAAWLLPISAASSWTAGSVPAVDTVFAIETAPRWCSTISVRKSRSNAAPRAPVSCATCAGVAIPGIAWTPSVWPEPTRSCRRLVSQSRSTSISGRCPAEMRDASARTRASAARSGARPASSSACPWWRIMSRTNATSAALNPGRGGRVAVAPGASVAAGSPGRPGWITGALAV
jgi:hypothetical protein